MKEFLIKNWYYIILAALAIAGFIVSLVVSLKKNKGANVFDSIKAALLENIPFWAVISEGLAGGETKKDNVISLGIALVSKLMGRKLSAEENDYFVAFIGDHLEKILATPQKKLEAPKKAQSGKYRAD